MGRPKGKGAARRGGAAPAAPASPAAPAAAAKAAPSPAQLIEHAHALAAANDYEGALAHARAAAEAAPRDAHVLGEFGALLAETGELEGAAAALRAAVAAGGGAARDDGFEKFMYLAQVLDSGAEAKECLEAGVAILERLLATPSATRSGTHADAEAAAHLRSQLAAALCALAEQVYCEDEELGADAEVAAMLAECEALYARAAGVDAGSPEPLHGLANVRLQQGRRDEARALMERSLAIWAPDCLEEESAPASAAADEVDPAAAEAAALASAAASLGAEPPSIEMRVEAAKLLLECEMARAARRVLRGLVAEDDRVFDAWCLLGLSHVHCARGGSEAARRDGADAARECADRAGALVREGDAYTEQSRAMVAALVEDADALHTDGGGGGGGGGGAGGDDMEL